MLFKIAIPTFGETLKVTEEGKFGGPGADYISRRLFLPINNSLINFDDLKEGPEIYLRRNVDFIYGLPTLPNLPENITSGPVYSELQCYLMSVKSSQIHLKEQKFQDSLKAFDLQSDIMIIILTMLLILILKITSNTSLLRSSWQFCEIFFQGYVGYLPRSSSFKLSLALVLIWLVLIRIVYLSFIHTDLIVMEKGDNIDTFDDIIHKKMSVSGTKLGVCKNAWRNAAKHSIAINETYRATRKTGPQEYADWFKPGNDITILMETQTIPALYTTLCFILPRPIAELYRSKDPVIHQHLIQFLPVRLSPEKRKKLQTYAYSNFESGFAANVSKLFAGALHDIISKGSNPGCVASKSKSIVLEPIKMTFFADSFRVFCIVCLMSIIVFLIEMILGNIISLKLMITGMSGLKCWKLIGKIFTQRHN